MTNIHSAIKSLVYYGKYNQLLTEDDIPYALNRLADLCQLDVFIDCEIDNAYKTNRPTELIKPLIAYAKANHLLAYDSVSQEDIFEAKCMDVILPRPSELNQQFFAKEHVNVVAATDFYYELSKQSNYIKTDRIEKNITWQSKTKYGTFDMTINLSKPEKDPKDIIKQKKQSSKGHIQCLLCKENVGYSGYTTNVGRTSHRVIPIDLNNEPFYLQYSPYVYYNEHCIVLHKDHTPMKVSKKTFKRLFDFVERFNHYFLGSNAGLPIVGGSILSHEHYQGGRHTFPIESADVLTSVQLDDVTLEKLYWPLSVIRLSSKNREKLEKVAIKLYHYWENYSDESVGIYSHTDAPHNAITPIARYQNGTYVLDMTLRNNLTSDAYPLGIFHPHQVHHHIKKENIGLIEVMGLAVLPARLKTELYAIIEALTNSTPLPKGLEHHHDWFKTLQDNKPTSNIKAFVYQETAKEFMYCLEDAGVFKQDDQGQRAFDKMIRGFLNA
ncbi:MAG: UDP-glucose--hexose-1-phosphate uridylyltransferase [Candidatus Izemoplasma sp.]|nr:UDP-glucose--hexose-1-phosphate uridylyltransferase [Candidatus Izemoplasma sp.]